jgi:hypothetical protein
LLQAIISNKEETVKYLIFKNGKCKKYRILINHIEINVKFLKFLIFIKADIYQKGEYGDSLVTALHFESSNNITKLILQKSGGVNLTSRHRDWV